MKRPGGRLRVPASRAEDLGKEMCLLGLWIKKKLIKKAIELQKKNKEIHDK